jgi:hypothetical protein
MPNGISINIGLNGVNPGSYGGWDGRLTACEFDARDMAAIAQQKGFSTTILLTAAASYAGVKSAIEDAAATLQTNDILFLTYSGHGGQVPDTNGDEIEDGKDETWVLYDRELVDDELSALWSRFQPGVRILVLSDSCHSGSVVRFREFDALWSADPAYAESNPGVTGFRAIPEDVQDAHYLQNQEFYDQIQDDNPDGDRAVIGASVLLISGCQDDQLSGDGPRNGVFTAKLRQVWADGSFQGNYHAFYDQIRSAMQTLPQTPNYFSVGVANPMFEAQEPFTV